MKALKYIAIIAAVVAAMASCKNTPKVEGVEPLSQGVIDSASYCMGVQFAAFIKNFADDVRELNVSEIKAGFNDFMKAQGDPRSEEYMAQFKVNPQEANQFFNALYEKKQEMESAKNIAEGKKFIEDLLAKGDADTTSTGLAYKIIEPGNDVKAGPADTVWCRYTGTLIDGTKFDGVEPDADPVNFTLDRVIPGWTEGMQLVGEGGKIKLYIPGNLAYGDRAPSPVIKANSTLVFEVEITKVGKKPVESPAE